MTKAEQVEIIKQRIDFEMDFLDVEIKKRNEAKEEFRNCSIEESQAKQSNLDRCYDALNNQYMYLRGVLAVAHDLDLISMDKYRELCKQVRAKVIDS